MTTADRILARVACARPISPGLLAADLRLSLATVKRHVARLETAGRLERDADGLGLDLTDAERHDRATDLRVATHR